MSKRAPTVSKPNPPHPAVEDMHPEDERGFVIPKTPTHSLQLLNHYMRTNLLFLIHRQIHQIRAAGGERKSPLVQLATSLAHVIDTYDRVNLFEPVSSNPHNIAPTYPFDPALDCAHDLRLMKG